MKYKAIVISGLLFVIISCTACGNSSSGNEVKNNSSSTEMSVQKETTEDSEKAENTEAQTDPTSTQKLKVPRTKEELEEAFGTMNEQGHWTPPEGSYIDPKTGNIMNKDGVVIGTTQKPSSKARPGSQG